MAEKIAEWLLGFSSARHNLLLQQGRAVPIDDFTRGAPGTSASPDLTPMDLTLIVLGRKGDPCFHLQE